MTEKQQTPEWKVIPAEELLDTTYDADGAVIGTTEYEYDANGNHTKRVNSYSYDSGDWAYVWNSIYEYTYQAATFQSR